MKWVYILQCCDDYYYIGETSRLPKNKTRKNPKKKYL